jgi:hypothetical protein
MPSDTSQYPWPQPYRAPWALTLKEGRSEVRVTKARFLRLLAMLERLAERGQDGLRVQGYRGLAPSRLERGATVGASEFVDDREHVRWPEAYAAHYVGKYNVRPSIEFIEYVLHRTRNLPHGRVARVYRRSSPA